MPSKLSRGILALAGCAALAMPAAAVAHGDEAGGHGDRGQRKVPTVSYIISGNVKSVATEDGLSSIVVTVQRSNRHGRILRGTDITVDVAPHTRVVTRDHNGDGERNVADIAAGDKLKVHTRMPKRLGPVGDDFRTLARRIIAKRPAPVTEPEPETETPQP